MADDIVDVIDEGLARKPAAVVAFTGPLTADQLIATLETLPPKLRSQPLMLSVENRPAVIVGISSSAVLLAEETPF